MTLLRTAPGNLLASLCACNADRAGKAGRWKGRFAKAYQPEELDLVDERITLNAPVDVAGSVRRSGAEVVVNGRLSSRASVECDRCLKAVELPISAGWRGLHNR